MFIRSRAFRTTVCFLTAVAVALSGCASRLPPSSYATQSGDVPAGGLSTTPYIVADNRPIKFVGFSPEERQVLERERRESIARRQETSSTDGFFRGSGSAAADASVKCILLGPVCLFVAATAVAAPTMPEASPTPAPTGAPPQGLAPEPRAARPRTGIEGSVRQRPGQDPPDTP